MEYNSRLAIDRYEVTSFCSDKFMIKHSQDEFRLWFRVMNFNLNRSKKCIMLTKDTNISCIESGFRLFYLLIYTLVLLPLINKKDVTHMITLPYYPAILQ